jgi:hypothetical protein
MKSKFKILLIALLFLAVPSSLLAADFGWMPSFNEQAEANFVDFRAKLAARFNIGPAQVEAVISNFPQAADAYVALRLGEMSGRPIDEVMTNYKTNQGKGWGVVAKSLGIKPGSKEFHALKQGDDLYGDSGKRKKDKSKDKKDKSKKDKANKDKGKNK